MNLNVYETCYLSPHSDDILFSAYYSIRNRSIPGSKILVTMFSNSIYVDKSKERIYDKALVAKVRTIEDRNFASGFKMGYVDLGFKDCQLRAGEVNFDKNTELPLKLVLAITQQLQETVHNFGIKNVVVPFPAGKRQHIDHRICKAVGESLEKVTLYYLDDYPYSILPEYVTKNMKVAHITDTNDGGQSKISDLQYYYPSQFSSYFTKRIQTLTTRRNNTEKIYKR